MKVLWELIGVMFMALFTVAGTNKVAEMQLNFWREKLPSIRVPDTIAASASPLTQEEANTFVEIIKDGNLRFHAIQFCNSAKLLCSQSVPVVHTTTSDYALHIHDYESDQLMNDIFFSHEELKEGGQITLPDFQTPWKAFLPRNLSQLIPFSTAALSNVLSSFGMSDTSNMAMNMAATLTECEVEPEQGEIKACTTSIEDMIEFVLSNFSSSDNLKLVSHPAPTADSGKKVKISKVVERVSDPSKLAPLVCHRFVYPYGVFYCHSINGTLTFTMELEVIENKGNHYNATALCHPNMQSKGSVYCHMVFGDSLLWLNKDKA